MRFRAVNDGLVGRLCWEALGKCGVNFQKLVDISGSSGKCRYVS